MWGGATFYVAMCFLREYTCECLEILRERVPVVPFQMLLRDSKAMGYTNYPNKLVHKFYKQAYKFGVELFHIFNYHN